MSMPETSPRYSICRYPTMLIDIWRSPRGGPFVLRPVLPQDQDLLARFYETLSPRSRRLRFHGAVKSLPQRALTTMAEVDPACHLALLVTFVSEGVETIVADARYIVDQTGRGGEFAIAVADVWQRRGIASRALAGLVKAARLQGLDRLWGEVLEDNVAMIALMSQAGFWRSQIGEGGVARFEHSVDCEAALQDAPSRSLVAMAFHWLLSGRSYA
jgi:acetyltransferase